MRTRGTATLALALIPVAAAVAWLVLDPRTPDLAAQVYRVGLFRQLGFSVWDDNWYAGHSLPGYSLLYPPLAVAVGMRVLALASVLASSVLFLALVRPLYGASARWGVVWFALAALGDVWLGRLTFALGVSLALGAGLAASRGRWRWAALLALLCAAASPVAAALLGLAGLTVALVRRSPRALIALAGPSAVLVGVLAVAFPEGGYEPYPILSFAASVAVVAAYLLALPRDARLPRVGGLVYLLACVACLAVHSPIGSNVERYGVLLAGPLLLCERLSQPRRLTVWPAAALCAIAVWVVWGPVRETLAVAGSEATSAAYYVPLERFLARVQTPPASPVRVEVPLTRSHWEAALLAPSVSLARGWDKQMETRYEDVLLAPGLTAAKYERWLHEQAVSYVALPDVELDPSSAQEGRLIRAGLPFLRLVFQSRHWRVYEVASATPLASGPGRLAALGHDSFTLRARSLGRFVVRVHFTRFWTLTRGAGCVAPAPGGWTRVSVRAPGPVVVSARFSLGRVFSSGGSCRG
ncbi:MAG TPA: hypothetical protein VK765_04695 [Solirubrobacteraceae bacterium]|nr:hypothetical protein [Solirubrobacteraceae bacterium]